MEQNYLKLPMPSKLTILMESKTQKRFIKIFDNIFWESLYTPNIFICQDLECVWDANMYDFYSIEEHLYKNYAD